MPMKPKAKVTHKYSVQMREAMMELARRMGDTEEATEAIRVRFGVTATSAYYWRRQAFGYLKGQKLAKQVRIDADALALLDAVVDQGHCKDRQAAASEAIRRFYGKGMKLDSVTKSSKKSV